MILNEFASNLAADKGKNKGRTNCKKHRSEK